MRLYEGSRDCSRHIHLVPTEEVDLVDETFVLLLCLFRTRCNVLLELGKCYNLLPCAPELPHRFDKTIDGIHLVVGHVNCFTNVVKNPITITNILLEYTFNAILGEVSSLFNRDERDTTGCEQAF